MTETSSLRHHRNVIETSPRHQQSITKTRRRHEHDTTETTPRRHRNIIAASPRHQESITKTRPRHHRDTPRHHPSNTKPRPTHHGDTTVTRPRHDREPEFFNLEASCVDIRATATLVCPKVHNIQIQIGNWDFSQEPDQNVHHCSSPKNQDTITTKAKKTLQHQRHNTKPSPTHHQNITAPSPHITETSPKHARDVANDQHITERSPKHHQKTNKTTPKQHRDITKKRQRLKDSQ